MLSFYNMSVANIRNKLKTVIGSFLYKRSNTKGKVSVVLLKKIRALGRIGDKVFVTYGYFFNNLFPKKLAVLSDTYIPINHNNENQSIMHYDYSKLENIPLFFVRQASNKGVLYGSVKNRDIANKIKEDLNIIVEPSDIDITDPIKKIGVYSITIGFQHEYFIKVRVIVGTTLDDCVKLGI